MTQYEKQKHFNNPIISGFYPDPSICRVGDDYYLVNSSFEYFPAIPIWHSKDLVHWEQIGHAIDREDQGLKLHDVPVSAGIQACTIRHHNGTFYITSTCIGQEWPRLDYNFVVTATDPRGPWSEVHYIQDAPGIDCSLFFDEDGTAYFHANRECENAKDGGDTEIWAQEINLETFELVGEKHSLWKGTGGIYPEGPHIYKRGDYYYLLIAEGGTCHFHTVSMARSKHVFGPYESNPRNPLLSHKHLHRTYPIHNVGHADLVETQNGEWYLVCLGSRPAGGYFDGLQFFDSCGGYYRNLGRETFLVPMIWEDDFGPIASPLTGKVELQYPFPNLNEHRVMSLESCCHFDSPVLDQRLNAIRNQKMDFLSLTERPGHLRLTLQPGNITHDESVSWLGIRQTSWHFTASTKVEFNFNQNGEQAGLTSYFNHKSHHRLVVEKVENETKLKLIRRFEDQDTLLAEQTIQANTLYLKVEGHEQDYRYYYAIEPTKWIPIGAIVDGRNLNCDTSGGHTGTYVALFASANGNVSTNYADFDYFEYRDL